MFKLRPDRCYLLTLMILAFLMALTACGAAREGKKLQAVATTTIVGDVVRAIGGDAIELKVLMPAETDPHSFEPTPQDAAAVADADVVFVNGIGLEVFLEPLLENAGSDAEIVVVSDGVELREFEGEHEHQHGGDDPHVWFDPNNVMVWVQNIEQTLSRLDAANAQAYAANARAYQTELQELDTWIKEQVAQVPEAGRRIVTDHDTFGYFANRYGFEMLGAVVPGYSTLAEPSAKELAELEDAIRDLGVKAVFVGNTVNPNLAQRVAGDTGTKLVFLYTGSLSQPDGPASNYFAYMRYNVAQMIDALR
jgi:manganese/iron transport system substrate-binding protein